MYRIDDESERWMIGATIGIFFGIPALFILFSYLRNYIKKMVVRIREKVSYSMGDVVDVE
jgi:hypothetical protein